KVPFLSLPIESVRLTVPAMAGLSGWPKDCGGTWAIIKQITVRLIRLSSRQASFQAVPRVIVRMLVPPVRGQRSGRGGQLQFATTTANGVKTTIMRCAVQACSGSNTTID